MAEGRTLVGLRAEGWRGARCWPRDRHLCTRLAVVTDAAGPGKTDRGDADRFEKQLRCNITRSAPQPHSREMQANIGRLFVCCTSAPGDGAPDENGHYTSQATPAITKVNDMLLARVSQQKDRDTEEELSPEQAGDEYDELVAEGSRCASREDWRVAAKAFREAISLRPDEPVAYLKLGMALGNSSWHDLETAQPFLLRRSSKEQFGDSARPFEAATSGCDGFLIDLDGTMYQPGGLLPGAREFYWWLVDSGTCTCHMHMHMHMYM